MFGCFLLGYNVVFLMLKFKKKKNYGKTCFLVGRCATAVFLGLLLFLAVIQRRYLFTKVLVLVIWSFTFVYTYFSK